MTDAAHKLNIGKVDELRRHMLLTKEQMAELLGISRVHYFNLMRRHHAGEEEKMRPSTRHKLRATLIKLLRVMQEDNWPYPEVIAMGPVDRYERLKEHIAESGT